MARALFTVSTLAIGIFAIVDPGWALRLKLEGYYSDLQLMLDVPEHLIAGESAEITASVMNLGPSDVDEYRLLIDTNLWLLDALDSPACEFIQPGLLFECVSSEPLLSGDWISTRFSLHPSFDAEGSCAIGALAASDHFDPEPANSFDVAGCWVSRRVDLVASVSPKTLWWGQSGLEIEFVVTNTGPSLAEDVLISARIEDAGSGSASRCLRQDQGACRTEWTIDLPPGATVYFHAPVPDSTVQTEAWDLVLTANPRAGEELAPNDNSARFEFRARVFKSGFEP
jgi:hypothetical protein